MIEQMLTEPTAMIVGWLIRGSLLLTALFLLAALLRREPSSTRHLLWTAGIGLALAIPVASAWMPTWEIEIPAGGGVVSDEVSSEGSAPVSRFASSDANEGSLSLDSGTPTTTVSGGSEGVSAGPASPQPELEAPRSMIAGAPTTDAVVQTRSSFRNQAFLIPVLMVLWFVVALILLVRFGASVQKTRAIVREANPVSDPQWNRSLLEISDRMELSRAPHLLVSRDAKVPMTCGVLDPAVVLPDDAKAWSVDRREAVLCHELAHIQRRDILSHLLGHVTCAFYWFYPLAWKAARLQRAESERACDDLVLSLGIRPSAYADHLLQIATAGHGVDTPAAALPMARPKEFEARLLSILAPGVPRGATSGWKALAPLILVVATAVPLVAFTPTPVPASVRPAVSSDETEEPDTSDGGASIEGREWISVDRGPGDKASVSIMDLITVDVREGGPNRAEVAAPTGARTVQPEPFEITEPWPFDYKYEVPLPFDDLDLDLDADGDTIHLRELERRTAQLGERVAEFISDLARDMEQHGPVLVDEVASVGVAIGEVFGKAFGPGVDAAMDRVMEGHGSGANAEDSFTRSLPVSGPVELEVMTGSGHIEILDGRSDRVEVHGTIQVRERDRTRTEAEALARLIAANPPIQHEDNGVRVGDADGMDLRWADEDNVTISYRITVPNRTSIVSHTGSGSQTIRGISGEVEATTGSGSIELGDIVGDVLAGTGSGNIRADGIGGSFQGSTGSGSIRLSQTRPGDVHLNTGSGAIHVEGIQGSIQAETGSGSIDVGGAAGPSAEWVLRTGSGRVAVDLPNNAAFNLNARSGSGSINIDHPITLHGTLSGFFTRLSSNRHRQVAGSVRGGGAAIDIETGSGSISVE